MITFVVIVLVVIKMGKIIESKATLFPFEVFVLEKIFPLTMMR